MVRPEHRSSVDLDTFDVDVSSYAQASESSDGARPKSTSLFALTVGTVVAGLVLHYGFTEQRVRFEEAALGKENTAVYGQESIHCRDVTDASACLSGIRARAAPKAVVWLGNSQLHAINQFKAGQRTAPAVAHDLLLKSGVDLVAFSQPNASLQEDFVLFEYLRSRLRMTALVLAAVFDDTREDGIRPGLREALDDPKVQEGLAKVEAGRAILARSQSQDSLSNETGALKHTLQERSELASNRWLDEHWPLWGTRSQFRGRFFLQLYQLRNTIFGISPQTKRRRILGRYRRNMAALRALLASARAAQIHVLVYIVPLREDVETPYVKTEYEEFKRDVRESAKESGAQFTDLEALVPSQWWGKKGSTNTSGQQELDFMHFQSHGHILLARAVAELVPRLISASEQ